MATRTTSPTPSARDVFDGELGRLDYNISDRHKFFYSFRHNYRVEDRNNLYHNIATGNLLNRINWGTMVDDVYTFSPTTVLNTRLNWTRFTEANDKPSAGYDFTKLGFPAYMAAASQRLVMPIIDLNQFTRLGRQRRRPHALRHFPDLRQPDQDPGPPLAEVRRGHARVARKLGELRQLGGTVHLPRGLCPRAAGQHQAWQSHRPYPVRPPEPRPHRSHLFGKGVRFS